MLNIIIFLMQLYSTCAIFIDLRSDNSNLNSNQLQTGSRDHILMEENNTEYPGFCSFFVLL